MPAPPPVGWRMSTLRLQLVALYEFPLVPSMWLFHSWPGEYSAVPIAAPPSSTTTCVLHLPAAATLLRMAAVSGASDQPAGMARYEFWQFVAHAPDPRPAPCGHLSMVA